MSNPLHIFYSLVAALFVARILSALFSILDDCDEVFNYWEPLHHIVYGAGMQTWEHSPEFALRSYAYLCIWAIPAKIFHVLLSLIFEHPSVYVFYAVRLAAGIVAAIAEVTFARALSRRFGRYISYYFLVFQILTTGSFQASCAFLPSSSFMVFSMWVWAFFLEGWVVAAVLASVATTCLWPFAGVCFLPFGFEVIRGRGLFFAVWTGMLGLLVLIPIFLADSFFYGRKVLSVANLVRYNLISGSSALYGVDSWQYYLYNLLLNLNVILGIGVIAPYFAIRRYTTQDLRLRLFFLLYIPMVLWCSIMVITPHKEERFLYPIYPLVTTCAAIALALFSGQKRFNTIRRIVTGFLLVGAIIFSLSRTIALVTNYSGQSQLWLHASTLPPATTICTGDAWYRFQSSFFLPPNGRLEFVREGFRGALPTHFVTTDTVPTAMNDKNREELSRYVKPSSCDYIAAELQRGTASFLGVKIEIERCWDIIDRSTPFPRRAFWSPDAAKWISYCLARVQKE